jgi:hypothetical protein
MLKLSEVFALISWQNEQTSLRVLGSTSEVSFSVNTTLSRFSDTGLSFQFEGVSDTLNFGVTGYDFEHLNQAAANQRHETIAAHPGYTHGLRASRGPQERVIILEIAYIAN